MATRHPPSTPMLSRREQQVLDLLATGQKVRAIADRLCVSPKTIESHIQAIRGKLGLRSVNEVIVYGCWQAMARS